MTPPPVRRHVASGFWLNAMAALDCIHHAGAEQVGAVVERRDGVESRPEMPADDSAIRNDKTCKSDGM